MSCTSCSSPLPADASFCPRCAAPVESGSKPDQGDPLRSRLERSIGAKYDIIRLLGRGGGGAVYLAREQAIERLVAIKVLPPESAEAPDVAERFKREAKTAAKLSHPNIVPLYTFGEADGLLYFVMGYVPGESLGDRLRRVDRLPEESARRVLSDIAGALDYAHRQGVVHRDLKPDNVLIDDDTGRAMLTDFGIARTVASGHTLTEVGSVVGTPHYMSPEQAAGERSLDGRSDIFPLGVIGYSMLTGRLPFEGDSIREVAIRLITADPEALDQPDVSGDHARAVMKSLSKAPEQRWQTGGELRAAIAGGIGISTALSGGEAR